MEPKAWIEHFVSYEYIQHCDIGDHGFQRSTFFCKDCPSSGPLCKECVSATHSSHTVLQVRKTSRRDSIKKDDIEPHITQPHQIFPYIWNKDTVFLLRNNSSSSPSSSASSSSNGCCTVCERRFHEKKNGVLYCSLECKNLGDNEAAFWKQFASPNRCDMRNGF